MNLLTLWSVTRCCFTTIALLFYLGLILHFWLYLHTWPQSWVSALANSSLCNSLLFPQSFTSTSSLQLLIIHYCLMLSVHYCPVLSGFPCDSGGEESACYVGDLGSIPGLGRSPGEGKGFPLQSVFWAWRVPWGCKELDTTEQLSLSLSSVHQFHLHLSF